MRNNNSRVRALLAVVGLVAVIEPALATRMNFFDSCVLAPLAVYRSNGELTAVGLTTRESGTVYFYFYGASGLPVASDDFSVQQDTLVPFIWDDFARGFEDVEGSLLFCLDVDGNRLITSNDGDGLAANAFLVDPALRDVAFLPTINVDDDALAASDPNRWVGNPVSGPVDSAAGTGAIIDMQYLIDGNINQGDDTRIYIWTSRELNSEIQPMNIFDGAGDSQPVRVAMPDSYLNSIDPEIGGGFRRQFLGDGFLSWSVPAAGGRTVYAFAFSIARSPSFGAAQTLLGNY